MQRAYILSQDIVKPRSNEIRIWSFSIALTFDWEFGSSAAMMAAKYQSGIIIITYNLAIFRGNTSILLANSCHLYGFWWGYNSDYRVLSVYQIKPRICIKLATSVVMIFLYLPWYIAFYNIQKPYALRLYKKNKHIGIHYRASAF